MMKFALPCAAVALAAAWILPAWRAPKSPAEEMQVHEFGRIPVMHNGRLKPLDSIARTLLHIVSDRETFMDGSGKSHAAVTWLLDAMSGSPRAQEHQVFRIANKDVQELMGVQWRERYRYSIKEFAGQINGLIRKVKEAEDRRESGHALDTYEEQAGKFFKRLQFYRQLVEGQIPSVLPHEDDRKWRTLLEAEEAGESGPDVEAWHLMLTAYRDGKVREFNAAVASYLERMGKGHARHSGKASLEARFNAADPFTKCQWLYLLGFVIAACGWLKWGGPLHRSAWALMAFLFVVHTASLVARIYISGRPPVTNLYSSAIFIGWGCAGLGLVLELLFKKGLGSTVTAVAGFSTLQIASVLAEEGDTMEVLQAVLDTQFWLATHVTCITMGYATAFVAGLLGVIFILSGVFTKALTPDLSRALTRMTYGVTCFSMFFSFVGTVLGGLWADDSWGRFWGWDPKENGALMIVLWNALMLHARWGGLARERGIAVLAVVGNVIVSWSWFGVNLLNIGLHSYGFVEGRQFWLLMFCLGQFVIIGLGCTSRDWWSSPAESKGAHAEGR